MKAADYLKQAQRDHSEGCDISLMSEELKKSAPVPEIVEYEKPRLLHDILYKGEVTFHIDYGDDFSSPKALITFGITNLDSLVCWAS